MSRYFTKFAATLLVLLGLVSVSHAQGTTNEDQIIRPLTKSGSAAFLFTISGLGTFGIGAPGIPGFNGGIGGKWFIADDLAVRVLLGVANNTTSANDTGKSLTNSTFGIGVGIEDHFRPLYSTSPYVGAQISYSTNSADVVLPSGNTASDKTNIFGIGAFAGFDWFFTRGIAAGAEIGLAFTSQGGTTAAGTSKTSNTNINLNTTGAVHLVVYF